ncbi:hypothetical protein GCM10023191_022760 [Actinoallomurus oryzae]|uniref:Uncharacterized protein n=2 Tax=Actinoallomurus oryzae TaxID=502180 RepID=A0ABP8PNJ3_9ACTN
MHGRCLGEAAEAMARSEPPKSATVVAAGVVEMSLRGASDDVERLVAKMRSEGIPVWRVPVQALNDGRNYSLNAEVDVKNTGNIGLLVNVKVSWPQFGTSPVVASKKVKVPYRKTVTVRFKRHASMTQITRI